MRLLLELRKLKRRRFPLMLLGLFGVEAAWILFVITRRGVLSFALRETMDMFTMLFPMVVGLIAVQLVGVDEEQRMGQLLESRGESPTRRFVRKLVLADLLVVAYHLLLIAFVLTISAVLRFEVTAPVGRLLPAMTVATVCGCLAVTAAQLWLAQRVRRPSQSVVVGLVAGLVAMSLPFVGASGVGWLFPWGLLPAAGPVAPLTMANRAQPDVMLVPHLELTLAAAVVAAVAWTALAVVDVNRQENRR